MGYKYTKLCKNKNKRTVDVIALTEKQKTFARALASGTPQIDAYIQAFDVTTVNRNSLSVMASREANKPEIKDYLHKVLQEEYNQVAIMKTRDEAFVRTILHERILLCRERNDETALSKYIEQLNKLNGSYVNITKDISEQDNDISKLSTDDLKALLTKEEPLQVSVYS